jgi:hypothetical protein
MGVRGSPSSKNFNRDGTSEINEAVRVRNTEVYIIVRCAHENLHIVRHSESRTGVCCGALVKVMAICKYTIHFLQQLPEVCKQQDSANKIKIRL